jgi:hypothetical protein
MRQLILALTSAAILLAAPAAFSAPTCQDRNGDTIRCGTPGAMPVGWTLPAEQRVPKPPVSASKLLELAYILGVFFALLALMPEFEHGDEGDWDKQEGDEHR